MVNAKIELRFFCLACGAKNSNVNNMLGDVEEWTWGNCNPYGSTEELAWNCCKENIEEEQNNLTQEMVEEKRYQEYEKEMEEEAKSMMV